MRIGREKIDQWSQIDGPQNVWGILDKRKKNQLMYQEKENTHDYKYFVSDVRFT